MVTLVLFSVFLILLVLNYPIGVCMGIATFIVIYFVPGAPGGMALLTKSAVMGGNNFPLIAIPMFVLVGEIMQTGGLSRRIIASAARVVGSVKAGLAYVNVLASMIFAAISGSSPATVAAIGSNMIPEMKKYGYDPTFSTAVTAASGTLGVMIPPSIPFIIYGVTASESIGALFLAGIIPGILFALFYAALSRYLLRHQKNDRELAQSVKEEAPASTSGIANSSWWALLVPIIILGGIYGGIFTPTEAAGVTVAYALIVSLFIYKELKWSDLPDILTRTSVTSVCCLIMVVMASPFGKLLTIEQVPNQVAEFITSLSNDKWTVILLINLMLLIVGMFMDTIAAIIILTPILLPVMVSFGVNPVHFGVILTCNLAIGFCTPPLGINLFVASNISEIPIARVIKAIFPFLLAMLLALGLISYIPAISLYLPSVLNS